MVWKLRCGMLLAAILSPLGSTMIAVALPGVGRELGASPGALNLWLVESYLLVSLLGQGPGGMLGDRIGHERALLAGSGLFALGALLGSIAPGLTVLAVARTLMAAGGAVTVPATMALLRNRIPIDRRARAFGVYGGALGLAAALGPLIGGTIVSALGWRAVFLANLPVVAAAILLVARPAWRATARDRHGFPEPRLEFRSAARLVDARLFRRREFAAGSLIIALQNLAMYALLFEIPVGYASSERAGAWKAEHLLFGMLAGMVVGSPLGGRLAERAGPRATALGGSILALGGLSLLSAAGRFEHPCSALTGLVLLGSGLGLSSAPAQAIAMSSVNSDEAGSAAGVLSTTRYLGGIGGIALLNAIPDPGVLHQVYVAALAAATLLSLRLPRAGPGRAGRERTARSRRSSIAKAGHPRPVDGSQSSWVRLPATPEPQR